ncbi:MAG TPA: TIGR01440 family protein [Clostridia bacterium]|nr:TIGR01440 family protein [Clostridia bacterium]
MLEEIKQQVMEATKELVNVAHLTKGQVVVVGCSTSEVTGHKIGSNSVPEVAKSIFDGIYEVLKDKGIFLAAQCCEHLNRAIIIEKEAVCCGEIVNVVPAPKAGGSFATAAYNGFTSPIAVEEIKADAGLDIGGTLIGMHLKRVAVPVRLTTKKVGSAIILAARTRPKFIGGGRANYDENLL